MKRKFTTGWMFLLGLPAFAIESPDAPAPLPPSSTPAAPGRTAPAQAPAPRSENPGIPPVRPARPVRPAPAPREEEKDPQPRQAEAAPAAFLGVGGSAVPELLTEHLKLSPDRGMVINTLAPDGPAAKAGLAVNDIIMKVGDREVGSQEDLREAIGGRQPGDEVSIDLIHRGEAKTVKVALGTAPRVAINSRSRILDDLRLDGLPEEQARRIREDVERNLRAFEDQDAFGGGLGDNPLERLAREAHRRLGHGIRGADANPGAAGQSGIDVKSTSTVRLLDEQGAVELRSEDGAKQVRAFDADGKLLWEGPYNNEEDKKAMPEDVRERVGKLNLDMDFKGGGLRFNMRPR